MKNLGKIFLSIFLAQTYLHAVVVASVDANSVALGDMVTLSIELEGQDIQRPNITTLCGENIISTSSNTSIQYINGGSKKKYTLSYTFIPTSSCTIKAMDISINARIEKTLAIDIKVQKMIASKDALFSLELVSSKKEVYLGEPFELTVIFRQKKSQQVLENKFTQPSFKGFWLKGEPRQVLTEDDEFQISKIIYTLAPQRLGELKIESANIKLARRENVKNYFGGLFPQVRWKTIFSNALKITTKPLPKGIHLVGDFSLEAYVSKTVVHPNEAVNLSIRLRGKGNLEDVKSFKPYLEGVSVFDEKILIEKNTLTQNITFVGDSSFTIEAFTLKTFNIQTKEIKTLTTEPIFIRINNAKTKEKLHLQKEEIINTPALVSPSKELNILWLFTLFFTGILFGILMMVLKPFLTFKTKKKFDVKDSKLLLVKLMPYKEDKEVQELIDSLESNLYSNTKTQIDKKVLKKIIRRYEIN